MGSRIRECPDQLFELFVEISQPPGDGEDPFILQKYPPDFNQQDVLNEIPKFAFPCQTEMSQVEQFVFVLTDIDGMFRYVYCRHSSTVNTCLCIMSHFRWFDIFYKMLNFLADIVNSGAESDPMPFLEATFSHDIPLPGVPVTIVAGQHMLNFTVPNADLLPSIHTSRNLTEYYNAVDANSMMKIFASMLHERRIIFTSKKLSRITSCIHAAEALLYPMHWQHLFIPVLPAHVIDMVTAPMPYVIGVHSSLMKTIESRRMDLGDAVIVDADTNEVRSEHDDLEALPDDVSSYLKRHLRTQKVQTSMMESGDAISRAFLLAVVRLIGGYRDALRFHDDEVITFDREAFVQSRTSRSTQAFLHTMLELQIFQQFITGRLELLNGGEGFYDVFEQESIKYADHLNTQSKYKEWLAKKTRKLKITDFKDKAAPAVSTAVQSVNVQRKKVMSKLREFNDNVKSSQMWKGGETTQRYSMPSMSRTSGSTPPARPPPPTFYTARDKSMKTSGRSTVYKTVVVEDQEESRHHGNSTFHQSFSLVDVTMETDQDIKMTLTHAASVDDLLFSESVEEGDTTSSSSNDTQTPAVPDAASISTRTSSAHGTSAFVSTASAAMSKDEGSGTDSPRQRRTDKVADKLVTADRLIPSRGPHSRSQTAGLADRLVTMDRLVTGNGSQHRPSEAAPVPAKRVGGEAGASQPHPPPTPRPRKAPAPQDKVKGGDDSPPPLPPKPPLPPPSEKPLIQFESVEDDAEQFDPLMAKEAPPSGKQQTSAGVDGSAGRHSSSSSSALMPGVHASFLRSATYRRAMEDGPVCPDLPDSASPQPWARPERPSMPSSHRDLLAGVPSTLEDAHGGRDCPQGAEVKGQTTGSDPFGQLVDLSVLNVRAANTVSADDVSKNSEGRDPQTREAPTRKAPSSEESKQTLSVPPNRPPHPTTPPKHPPSHISANPFTSTTPTPPSKLTPAPLRPPPPLPRPRPRQNMATTAATTTPSTLAEPSSSSSSSPHPSPSIVPPRPAVLPKPPSAGQQGGWRRAQTLGPPSSRRTLGAVEDLLGLEHRGATEGSVPGPGKALDPAGHRHPLPVQRASLRRQRGGGGGGGVVTADGGVSTSPALQQPPSSSGKQWETFD